MKICPHCAHNNLEGIFFCEECGEVLFGEYAQATSTKRIDHATNGLVGKNTWGTARFTHKAEVIMAKADEATKAKLRAGETTINKEYKEIVGRERKAGKNLHCVSRVCGEAQRGYRCL